MSDPDGEKEAEEKAAWIAEMRAMDDPPELKRDVPTNVFLRMIHEANHSGAVLETDGETDAP